MFKHSKLISVSQFSQFKSNLSTNNSLFSSLQKFNFARMLQKFVPIFPGDKVIVLPPWATAKLNPYAKRQMKLYHKEDSKIEYGTVLRVKRKQAQAIVSRVNEKPKYVSPSKFLDDYEYGNISKIKRKVVNLPVAIERVRLRDLSRQYEGKLKIMPVKLMRNEAGERIRVNKITLKEVPIPLNKKDFSYAKRAEGRKDGTKDTPAGVRSLKTYNGENFCDIAKFFIKKIQSKEGIEKKLILKDK